MKKISALLFVFIFMLLSLSGCSAIGDKAANMTIIYDVTAVISFILLICYCCLIKKKDIWFLLLFSSVFVVNVGYLTLAISGSLEEALLANRLAYLGSACLPMSMLMIIMNVCGLKYKRWFPGFLLGVGTIIFLISASPGYLDIYYSDVSLSIVNGVAILDKVYGPWHCCYLFYLLSYFVGTTATIAYAASKNKIETPVHAVILASAFFVNTGVWLLEQLVRIDIELLSVSYVISELFLLCLCLLMQEGCTVRLRAEVVEQASPPEALPEEIAPPAVEPIAEISEPEEQPAPKSFEERCEYFTSQLPRLTPTERVIYNLYLSGTGTKDIMATLNIKENTLKYHNKNIYGKLGVSSRKELLEIAAALKE